MNNPIKAKIKEINDLRDELLRSIFQKHYKGVPVTWSQIANEYNDQGGTYSLFYGATSGPEVAALIEEHGPQWAFEEGDEDDQFKSLWCMFEDHFRELGDGGFYWDGEKLESGDNPNIFKKLFLS